VSGGGEGRRVAAIDVGTNTVLLLVAEGRAGGPRALAERAEITRLGRGVDAAGRLEPAAIAETAAVLGRYAAEARALGAERIACVATSAARDASNGADFFAAARAAAGLVPEVITGDEEARLVWRSAWRDFGGPSDGRPGGALAVLDVGGGSTELSFGDGPAPRGRRSLQVGAVRLTERLVQEDPISPGTLATLRAARAIARREGLRYVYTGNVHDPAGDATICHGCGAAVIERDWYQLLAWRLVDGACGACGAAIAGRFDPRPGDFGRRRLRVHIGE